MSIPSWAKVGAKVVCVDDSHSPATHMDGLAKGTVYTIRWVGMDFVGEAGMCVRLVEIIRDRPYIGHESAGRMDIPYMIGRFRPVQTKTQEQDMEMFAPLLTGKRKRASPRVSA